MDDSMVTDEINDRLKPERGITKKEVERMNDMMEMKEELRKLNNKTYCPICRNYNWLKIST